MIKSKRFPYLWTLMNAWLDQDYDFEHQDEMLVIDDFVAVKAAEEVASIVTEIDMLLNMPTKGLLQHFIAETGSGNMLIADDGDDEGAREWLCKARARMTKDRPLRR